MIPHTSFQSHFSSALSTHSPTTSPPRPLGFAANPVVQHVPWTAGTPAPMSQQALKTLCSQRLFNAGYLDQLGNLPSHQRSEVYGTNNHLRIALGMSTDKVQKVSRIFKSSTAPAPAAPLKRDAAQGGVGWQRYFTELAQFAGSINKESKESKAVAMISRGLPAAENGTATPDVMRILLKPENFHRIESGPRSSVLDLLKDVIGAHANVSSAECSLVLLNAFVAANSRGGHTLKKIEGRILDGLKARGELQGGADFRGETLTRTLEAACAADYPDSARRSAFKIAQKYRSDVVAYLNGTTPRPQLTQAAGIHIARWLSDQAALHAATPDERTEMVALVLLLAMSIPDEKESTRLVDRLIDNLPGSADELPDVVAGALMKLPENERLATMACMIEQMKFAGKPPSAAIAQGLALAIVESHQAAGAGSPPLQEYACAVADVLSTLDGKDAKTYGVVVKSVIGLMGELDRQIKKIVADAGKNGTSPNTPEYAQLHVAKRAIVDSIRLDAIKALMPLALPVPAFGKTIEPEKLEAVNEHNAASSGLRKEIAELLMRRGDKESTQLIDRLIANPSTPAEGQQDIITETLMKLPEHDRLAVISCMTKQMKISVKPPSAAIAQGLVRAIVASHQTAGSASSLLPEYACAAADVLSTLDGKDWKTYGIVFEAVNGFMGALDQQVEKIDTDSVGEDMAVKSLELVRLDFARRAIIESIRNDALKALTPLDPPVPAAGKTIKPEKLQAVNERNAALKALRKDIAELLVLRDDIVLPCAEKRLQALHEEIGVALKAQAAAWASKTEGAQMLTWKHILPSSDLSSSIAIAPVKLLGQGGNGSAYLFKTSSPALPSLVLKLPLAGDGISAEMRQGSERTLTREFRIYRELHAVQDRNKSKFCWCYGLASIKHPADGADCMVLALEALDGENMTVMRNELSFEASKRHLLHEYAGIYQYEQRVLIEAIGELSGIGYVHADLKPANVMATRDGSLKVIDLGLARKAGTIGNHPFGTTGFLGTEASSGYNVRGTKIYAPNVTTDIYSAAISGLDGLENAAEVWRYEKRPKPVNIESMMGEKVKVIATDEKGIPYRGPTHFMGVVDKAKSKPHGYPLGAFESYYTQTLDEIPGRRPQVQEALEMPYISDPIVTEDEAREALARAVEQYRRREGQDKVTVQKHAYLSDKALGLKGSRLLPEQSGSDMPMPKDAYIDAWLKTQPGIAIPRSQKLLSYWRDEGNDVNVLVSLDIAVNSLQATIGRKENLDVFKQYLEDCCTYFWNPDSMTGGKSNPHEVSIAVTGLHASLTKLLAQCGNDPRAYNVLHMSRLVTIMSLAICQKYTSDTAALQPIQDLLENVVNTYQDLGLRIQNIAVELDGKYKNQPQCLEPMPMRSLANRLLSAPAAKSGLKSAPPLPGRENWWPGWISADDAHAGQASGTKKAGPINIDAEIEARSRAAALGGFGVEISDEEIAMLKKNRDVIRATRDELLHDIKKYWGAGDVTQTATDGEALLRGVGSIPDVDLEIRPIEQYEKKMRNWLSALERLLQVIDAVEAEEAASTSGNAENQKGKSVAVATGEGSTPAVPETQADRFAASKAKVIASLTLSKDSQKPE